MITNGLRLRWPPCMVLFAFLIVLAVGVAGCGGNGGSTAAPLPELPSEAAPTINQDRSAVLQAVAIGDVFTGPSRFGGFAGKNWTTLLQRNVSQAGIDMYVRESEVVRGYTETKPADRSLRDEVVQTVNFDTDIVILFGGAADGKKVDSLAEAVTQTIAEARAIAPAAKVIVVGPLWGRQEAPSAQVVAVDDTIGRAATTSGAVFISPIRDQWLTGQPELVSSDGAYLTDAGHAVVAERLTAPVVDAARQVLSGSGNP